MIPLRDDNPSSLRPIVTLAIIGACVLIFFWQFSLGPADGEAVIYALGFTPAVAFGYTALPDQLAWVPAPVTIFTSMFLHGGLLHLAGNMLYLWIFADNIEDRMGHSRFVLFYALCGLAAAMAQGLLDLDSAIPMIGASGAVSGVLGAYVVLFPRARVLVALPVFVVLYTLRLPAIWVLGLWFVGQLLSSIAMSPEEGGVAFQAHIGGFVAGLLLVYPFVRRPRHSRDG
ncbi:MAG TPA: rhomboid family intramembrane serine protease [Gammaproteobacteria bacterium]|jgi:membrane associated rhomboid family serine protease